MMRDGDGMREGCGKRKQVMTGVMWDNGNTGGELAWAMAIQGTGGVLCNMFTMCVTSMAGYNGEHVHHVQTQTNKQTNGQAHQNNICMVAERSQDLPSACACDLSLRSPPSPALSAMFATAENVVRPGTMNMENEDVAITIVDTATMFKLMVGSTLLLEKYVVNRWKKYSSMPIYLEGPPILDSPGSFLEMDSPGSRLAGALALYDRHRGVAQEDAPRQQGQLFLKQVKRQEENFKEKLVQLQHDYNVQLQRTKIGMGNKDQANNNEICDLRQELQQYQATILEHNKMIDEITDHDN